MKKYQAMQNAVCRDGRAHGMFQFYGANRSGRWAGRLTQLQNLPQNHLPDLEQARQYVIDGEYEMLDLLYDSVPAVLSELIRTTFVPRPGYKFIVSDFSAIEARVLAFLAGETWKSKVFSEGKRHLLRISFTDVRRTCGKARRQQPPSPEGKDSRTRPRIRRIRRCLKVNGHPRNGIIRRRASAPCHILA